MRTKIGYQQMSFSLFIYESREGIDKQILTHFNFGQLKNIFLIKSWHDILGCYGREIHVFQQEVLLWEGG